MAQQEQRKDRFAAFDNPRGWRTVEAVKEVAAARDTTPSAVALAWLLAKPQVSSVIFGARSLQQVDDNLKAVEVQLGADDVKKLDDASKFDIGYPYNFLANIQPRW